MIITVKITLTNTGPDLGPYNLYLIDYSGGITNGPTNITKAQLLSGYELDVDSSTVETVRVKSVSVTCTDYYLDLNIPS